ncbi:UvrD-helicase domain-containing protein [Bacillus cereus group sp. BfR-BA-01361]|uniref:UvrD-helicase domain-containing protein n=1 Tax=Bacillus cereus group sp. BfR-BA-01361 TaxID=2920322 RepID=UPI001F56A8A3|nr:ATP-dependent helicase [Bacillus cereus group sp. BfR-BA-01361]
MNPSKEQQSIIDYTDHTVVVAQPGSGKTFTLSNKIVNILSNLPIYKGVIAISFTRKASRELEKRCLQSGIDKKGTFFGTMDKFYISEIILPFGRHLFGKPCSELEIIEKDHELVKKYIVTNQTDDLDLWLKNNILFLQELYKEGYVLLESVSTLALYILKNSKACTNYLKARYSHIIIDEYQDCGREQHEVFITLKELGLIAIAVGDINQSIYGFANKSSDFLINLAQDQEFKLFHLTRNHRCHPSIINYSTKLISKGFTDFIPTNESRVFSKRIDGTEQDIAKWLNQAIPSCMAHFGVKNYNEIGILVRGNRTGKFIDQTLSIDHKFFDGTPLDNDSSLWGNVFESILNFIYNNNTTKYELLETYLDLELQLDKAKQITRLLNKIENIKLSNSPIDFIDYFISVARIIHPNAENINAINILKAILDDQNLLDKFKPAESNEVQIMTLHKSKGLEFKIVFHLDLYEYIFPKKYNNEYIDPIQDLNLHYVGITRAQECCILCTSSRRHNSKGQVIDGVKSAFLRINRLVSLREVFMY